MWVQPLAQEDPLEEEMTTCLENSMDRGVWWNGPWGSQKNQTQLSD